MLKLQFSLEDAISFAALMQDQDEILGGEEVTCMWEEFEEGKHDDALESLGLPSPRSAKGPALAPTPGSRFSMRSERSQVSNLTDHGGDNTFRTARVDDWESAASDYDPGQMTYILKRLSDLSDFAEEVEDLNLQGLIQDVKALERRGRQLSSTIGTLPALPTTQSTSVGSWVSELRRHVEQLNQSLDHVQTRATAQATQTTVLAGQVRTHEATFTEPDKMPAIFNLVVGLATVINGRVDGHPGDGLNQRIATALAQQHPSFGTSPSASQRGSGFAGFSLGQTGAQPVAPSGTDPRVPLLEARVRTLETTVHILQSTAGAAPASVGGSGGLYPSAAGGGGAGAVFPAVGAAQAGTPSVPYAELLQRAKDLERLGSGAPIVMGSHTFSNEGDVRAFVNLHVQVPYLGVLTDLVVLLQKL